MAIVHDKPIAAASEAAPRKSISRAFLLIGICIPPLLCLLYIARFGVNVVYADEWVLVPLVEKMYSGTLTVGDLFTRHNEHILLFPKIVILALARLTHYNTVAEMFFSFALICLALFLMFLLYRRGFGRSVRALLQFLPISLLLFNLRQSEDLLVGFQMTEYFGVAGFVAAIFCLEKRGWVWFFLAVFAGVVSSFSNANGLLVWPVGIVFLLIHNTERKRLKSGFWVAATAAVIVTYLIVVGVSFGTGKYLKFQDLVAAPVFFILNIGSPLAFVKSSAIGMGAAVGLFMATAAFFSLRETRPENAKWLAFILFSLGSSFLYTVGRVHFGLWAALASRYVPFTSLGIIGAYLILLDFYEHSMEHEKQQLALWYGGITVTILIGMISGYAGGIVLGQETAAARKQAVTHLVKHADSTDEELEQLALYNPTLVREGVVFLEKRKLNVFSR